MPLLSVFYCQYCICIQHSYLLSTINTRQRLSPAISQTFLALPVSPSLPLLPPSPHYSMYRQSSQKLLYPYKYHHTKTNQCQQYIPTHLDCMGIPSIYIRTVLKKRASQHRTRSAPNTHSSPLAPSPIQSSSLHLPLPRLPVPEPAVCA